MGRRQDIDVCVVHILKIGGGAAFGFAALDEGVELFAYGGIDRRLGIFGKRLLVDAVGFLPGFRLAGGEPLLVIAPVGNDRRIEGALVACERVLCAEEMTAGAHLADGVDA